MKKMLAMLLALLMLCCAAHAEPPIYPAAEESATLSYEEIQIYLAGAAQAARADGDLGIVQSENGPVVAVFAGGSMEISDPSFTEDTAVLRFDLAPGQKDLRGLRQGDSLEQLLPLYPNHNPDLFGSYYDAALYVDGEKPEASAGYLLRDGQRVTEAVYTVFHWAPQGVIRCGVRYTLDQGMITGITVFGMDDVLPEAEALERIQEIRDMMEISDYFAYPQSADGLSLSPFQREDLTFSGLDFLDLTAESALAALGSADSDQWTEDSTGEWLRIMQWNGVSLLLLYDAGRQFLRPDSLTVTADVLEGPRGVRVGDLLDSVIFRFRHGEGGVTDGGMALYGQDGTAPYGLLAYDAEGAALTYALALDEDTSVLWHLSFADARLESMRLLLR